jgi:hypothetical protein
VDSSGCHLVTSAEVTHSARRSIWVPGWKTEDVCSLLVVSVGMLADSNSTRTNRTLPKSEFQIPLWDLGWI